MRGGRSIPVLDIKNVSFIVNTKRCGDGELVCIATHADGQLAKVRKEKIDEHIYRVKIYPLMTGHLHLHFDMVTPPIISASVTAKMPIQSYTAKPIQIPFAASGATTSVPKSSARNLTSNLTMDNDANLVSINGRR